MPGDGMSSICALPGALRVALTAGAGTRTARACRHLIVAAILACGFPALAAPDTVPHARDLAADAATARAQRSPLLLFFTQTHCPYCAKARTRYVGPLADAPSQRTRVVIREIDIETDTRVRGFRGEITSPKTLAKAYGVRAVPTVIVVDGTGRVLADPIVGLSDDFYAAYLDNALEAGLAAVRGPQ